jgi:hypothetical protein
MTGVLPDALSRGPRPPRFASAGEEGRLSSHAQREGDRPKGGGGGRLHGSLRFHRTRIAGGFIHAIAEDRTEGCIGVNTQYLGIGAAVLAAIGSAAQSIQSYIMDVPQVPSIAALSNLPIKTARTVAHVLGQNAPGDGGDNLYSSSFNACTLNSGAGDNYTQVEDHHGKCWLLSSPQRDLDFLAVQNADPTDRGYNDVPFEAWLAALQSSKRCGHWNAGTYKFQSPIDVDMGSAYASGICIRGDGVHLTLIDMTNITAGSVSPVQLTALPYNNANCGSPTNCGTTTNPSIGFYFKFQDIGIYGNISTAPLFSIGTPAWTDQLNWIDVRAWVSNASPSAAAIATQVGVTASGNSIELIANNGGHGVGVNVTAATMTDFRISGCNCDKGVRITGSTAVNYNFADTFSRLNIENATNDVYIDGIYGGQILFLSGDFSYRNGGAAVTATSGAISGTLFLNPNFAPVGAAHNISQATSGQVVEIAGNRVLGTGLVAPTYTIAGLPACGSGQKGQQVFVSDTVAPTAATFHGTPTGGGSTAVNSAATCNGTAWQYD